MTKKHRVVVILILLLVLSLILGLMLVTVMVTEMNRYVVVIPAEKPTLHCLFSHPPLIEARHRARGRSLCLSQVGVAYPPKRIVFIADS